MKTLGNPIIILQRWNPYSSGGLHLLGEVPEKGAEVQWQGFRFVVTGMDAQRLTEVCVHPPEERAMEGKG